ncbi:MAG: fumarate hydratase, partial [Chlorobiaceae bacterium]|nr:fumarate hydratase [Chlorobiaceae bacterium]
MQNFRDSIISLITETSANLPSDVREVLAEAISSEDPRSQAGLAMSAIALNIDMAVDNVSPICQDTGMPTFFIHTPPGADQLQMKKDIQAAVAEVSKTGKLRPNAVDAINGKNSGNNLGEHFPVIHFEPWAENAIEVRLILKGGGCENKNMQYSLPAEIPGLGKASRDLDGVRKCLLHAVFQA